MPRVEIDPDDPTRVLIETQFVDRHQIKMLPGAAYDGRTQRWHAPLSWGTCVTLRGLFGDALELGDVLMTWSWREYNERVKPSLELRTAVAFAEPWEANADLRPFQQVGVRFLSLAGQGVLMDDMGSGKTVQIVRTIRELYRAYQPEGVFPALVICPNGVKYVWDREFTRWWPEVRVQVVTGGAAERRKQLKADADVFVINYESVRLHSRLAAYGSIALQRCHVCDPALSEEKHPQRRCEWCQRELNEVPYRTVIVDEAHRLKDPRTKQTRAVWGIMHGKSVWWRFGMTGTPISKDLSDLWAIMHGISPLEYPTKTKFVDRYVERAYSFFGGMETLGVKAETRDELFKILDPRTRRLPKEVILPQLPPKIYSERYLEMSARQLRAYRQMERHMLTQLEDGVLIAKNPLVKVGRLMQFASAFAELVTVPAKDDDEDDEIKLTLSEPSNKVDALVDLLDELGDEPLVVFAASKQLIKIASARLERLNVPHGLATGDQTPAQRQRSVDRFQAGEVRVLLGTIDAAGEGLTMTRARVLCFLQRHWSALKNAQAEGRVHRIGSEVHDSIEIIDLISLGTVEQRQRDVLSGKLARLEEVVRDREMLALLLGAGDD